MTKLSENNLTKYLYLALILLLTFVLYVKAGSYGFISVWDDNLNVLNNPYIRNLSFDGIKTIFSSNTPINEPRFTILTYAIDYKLWQLNPRMYHLENVILHLLNVMLVFLLAIKLLKDVKISALVAALFAFHPFRLESVAWVSGRKDLLFTFFFLMAILFYIEYLRKERLLWFLLVLILAWLAFQSKIQAVTLPATLLLVELYFKRKLSVMMIFEKFLIALVVLFNYLNFADIMALLMFYLMFLYRDSYLPRMRFLQKYIANPGKETLSMLLKYALILFLFWFIYSLLFRAILSQFLPMSYYLTMIIAVGWLIWFGIEKWIKSWKTEKPSILFIQKYQVWIVSIIMLAGGVLLFFIYGVHMFPLWNKEFTEQFSAIDQIFMAGYSLFWYMVYAIFPLELSTLRPYPDFTAVHLPKSYYILSVFALFMVAGLLWLIFRMKHLRRRLTFGLLFFGINIFLVLHLIPIEGRVILAERYTYLAYFGLFLMIGLLLGEIKKPMIGILPAGLIIGVLMSMVFYWISYRGLNTWKDEFTLLDEQVSKNPEYPMAYLNRSTLFINKADYIIAIKDLDKAIALNPKFYQAYYNRGLSFSRMNIFDKAADDCTLALCFAPGFADAHYLRAFAMAKMQLYTEAIAGYSQAIKLNPLMYLAYYNRGNSLTNCREYEAAIADYQTTIVLNPKFSDAYSSRGVARFFMGSYEASLADYEKAITLNPQNGNYYFNRALSYKELLQHDRFCADMQTSFNLGYQPAKQVLEEQCR
jgi:tetratricopeptide (TPR) repeat protein